MLRGHSVSPVNLKGSRPLRASHAEPAHGNRGSGRPKGGRVRAQAAWGESGSSGIRRFGRQRLDKGVRLPRRTLGGLPHGSKPMGCPERSKAKPGAPHRRQATDKSGRPPRDKCALADARPSRQPPETPPRRAAAPCSLGTQRPWRVPRVTGGWREPTKTEGVARQPLSGRSPGGAAGSWGPACGTESAGNGPRAEWAQRRPLAQRAKCKAAAE